MKLFKPQQKRSVMKALNSGDWERPSFSWTVTLAAASALGDIITTSYSFLAPGYSELSPSISYFAQFDAQWALTFFFFISLAKLLLAVFDLSWVSEAVAIHTVATNGMATLSNLVMFLTGFSFLGWVGFTLAAQIANVVSVIVILALLYRWRTDILEVMAVGALALIVLLIQLWSYI